MGLLLAHHGFCRNTVKTSRTEPQRTFQLVPSKAEDAKVGQLSDRLGNRACRHQHRTRTGKEGKGVGGGAYSFVACLDNLTIGHASHFSRRSTVPTPNRDTSRGGGCLFYSSTIYSSAINSSRRVSITRQYSLRAAVALTVAALLL